MSQVSAPSDCRLLASQTSEFGSFQTTVLRSISRLSLNFLRQSTHLLLHCDNCNEFLTYVIVRATKESVESTFVV